MAYRTNSEHPVSNQAVHQNELTASARCTSSVKLRSPWVDAGVILATVS